MAWHMKQLVLLIAVLELGGCQGKYQRTLSLPASRLYVERFSVSPFGVNADYLTDSLTFRQKVGTYDVEHESFIYACRGDSVQVLKLNYSQQNCRWIKLPEGLTVRCDTATVARISFNLKTLQVSNSFE
jgi:hypothetical protein